MIARIMLTIEREVEIMTYTGYRGLDKAEKLVRRQAVLRLGPKYTVSNYWAEDVTMRPVRAGVKKSYRGKRRG